MNSHLAFYCPGAHSEAKVVTRGGVYDHLARKYNIFIKTGNEEVQMIPINFPEQLQGKVQEDDAESDTESNLISKEIVQELMTPQTN